MSAQKALLEVENLIKLGVKEIMEDSGSLPIGEWLQEFCQGMIEKGFNEKVTISCNMRITGIKNLETWKLMKKAGFRFILFGLPPPASCLPVFALQLRNYLLAAVRGPTVLHNVFAVDVSLLQHAAHRFRQITRLIE